MQPLKAVGPEIQVLPLQSERGGLWRQGAEPESAANGTLRSRHNSLPATVVVEGAVLQVSDEEEFSVFPAESELPGYL